MNVFGLYFACDHQTHHCQYGAFEKAVLLVLADVQLTVRASGHHEVSKVELREENGLLSYLVFYYYSLVYRED